jgi:hypothetical protein
MNKRSARQKKLERIDKHFEMYIRIRDGWKCIICGAVIKDKTYMHAGHFVTRGNEAVRYDEINVNAQCHECNSLESSTSDKSLYREALVKKYGEEALNELILRSNSIIKHDLDSLLDEWKEKLKEIKQSTKDSPQGVPSLLLEVS